MVKCVVIPIMYLLFKLDIKIVHFNALPSILIAVDIFCAVPNYLRTEEYEEITNLRKFDAESLFSQVVGLIGIMIGASFFNIPDILLNMVSKFETIFKRIFFTTQLNRTESGSLIAKPFANTVSTS